MAWRWYILTKWHGVLTMNLLEFLASEVPIYMTIQKLIHGTHILAFTDIIVDANHHWRRKQTF